MPKLWADLPSKYLGKKWHEIDTTKLNFKYPIMISKKFVERKIGKNSTGLYSDEIWSKAVGKNISSISDSQMYRLTAVHIVGSW